MRPAANTILRLCGYQVLPAEGQVLSSLCLGMVCVEDENVQVLQQLVDKICVDYKHSHYGFILAGFHDKDPLRQALAGLGVRQVRYRSQLFFAHWEDGAELAQRLGNDGRVPYLELATL